MSGQIPLPSTPVDLPLLPLRDVVVFPHMVIPLFVGRPKSIKALESAMEAERRIMLVAQKAAAKDEPSTEDMFEMGCVATILQMLKLPDGTVKVLVEGNARGFTLVVGDARGHGVPAALLLAGAAAVSWWGDPNNAMLLGNVPQIGQRRHAAARGAPRRGPTRGAPPTLRASSTGRSRSWRRSRPDA